LGKRILVADASETIISVCRKLLGQHGYEVTLFQDGTRALEELKRSHYDLAVIATTTQNVSGQFVIRELRQDAAKAKLPILMLLGSSELLDTQELFDLGPNDTLNKPFSPQELLHRIETILKTTGEPENEPEEDLDIESILSDDTKSFEKKVSEATDKIFLDMLSTTQSQDDGSDAPRLDKLDLAEDQYDLESVKMGEKAETDSPHDYDWFVSEMKGETPPPAKPERSSIPAGKFEVEEVGTSKITLDKLKKMQTTTEVDKTKVYLEKLQEPFTDDTGHESARLKDSRQTDMRQAFVKHFAEALAREVAKGIDFDKLVEALRAEISRSGQK
jgi:two-component system, OmpR family, response regulator